MNWRRTEQPIYDVVYRDFFAPESVLTPDGRRVMCAWLSPLDDTINPKTIQSLPRERSLGEDGSLRIRPLRELESHRYDAVTMSGLEVTPPDQAHGGSAILHSPNSTETLLMFG